MLRDVVAQEPSKTRRIKNVDGYFFPEQCSCSGGRPAKQRLPSASKLQWGYDRATENRQ